MHPGQSSELEQVPRYLRLERFRVDGENDYARVASEAGFRSLGLVSAGERPSPRPPKVGGSSLPACQNGTCLVYCQAGKWQIGEGGLAEGGRL